MKTVFQSKSFDSFRVVNDGYSSLLIYAGDRVYCLLNSELHDLGVAIQKHLKDVLNPLPATSLREAIGKASPYDVGKTFTDLSAWIVRENVKEIVEQTWGHERAKIVEAILKL